MDITNINNIKTDENKDGIWLKAKDGKEIFLYCWDNVSEPKAVIQIFHGMAEHAGRYRRFADYLNSKGFIVYGDDHRGHGKTAKTIEELGIIGEDGFNRIVEDEHTIKEWINKKYPNLPIIVFAHSFGSFIGQEYILRYGKELSGIILCGSAARNKAEIFSGRLVTSIEKKIFGESKKSKLLDYLSFSNCNKKISNSKSKFDWLSRDINEVKKYEEDQLCGKVFSTGFYYHLFRAFSKLYNKERLSQIPKDLPIFIISGSGDPIGEYGKLVNNLHNKYLDNQIKYVKLKLYPEARHELLNETNRQEVYDDISQWVNNHIKPTTTT